LSRSHTTAARYIDIYISTCELKYAKIKSCVGDLMSDQFIRRPIDFYFDFDTAGVAVGEEIRTGETGYGYEADGRTSVKDYDLDNESVMEVEGIEIIGPNTGTERYKLKSVRLVIDGREHDEISLNELMAPAYLPGTRNVCNPDFRDYNQSDVYTPVGGNYVCTNLGKGMLAGGSIHNATPKIGPGQNLLVKVQIPRTAEGGQAISSGVMRVRLHTIQVRGEDKLLEVMQHYGHIANAGQPVNASWTMGDLANTSDMPIKLIEKTVPNEGGFGIEDWSSLPGGNEVELPYVERMITYGQNNAATTPNSWYDFTMEGSNVTSDFQQLDWNFTKRDAVKVEHMGVLSHNYLEWVRLWIDGAPKNVEYKVTPELNQMPMPQGLYTNSRVYNGPARLGRAMWVWNQHGSIQIKDNGTAIPAWSTTPIRGAMVGVWGHRYHLRGNE